MSPVSNENDENITKAQNPSLYGIDLAVVILTRNDRVSYWPGSLGSRTDCVPCLRHRQLFVG